MARVNGTINTSSSASDMTATAKPRLPPIHVCRRSMRGHVATTIVTAQTKAGRNGFRMKKLAAMRATIKSTASIVRVRSREGGGLVMGGLLCCVLCDRIGCLFHA